MEWYWTDVPAEFAWGSPTDSWEATRMGVSDQLGEHNVSVHAPGTDIGSIVEETEMQK
jgi:hypothetical protein